MTLTEADTDGRKIRGQRNRDAVVDAILSLLHEGNGFPAVADIAARSGVSVRSVFRHFDDLESLYAAAVQRHMQRLLPLFEPLDPVGPMHSRIDALAAQRARLYEEITAIRLVAERLQSSSAAIAEGLDLSHRTLRLQVTELFSAELKVLTPAVRKDVADAIDASTSWIVWHELRTQQRCSIARAHAIFVRIVTAILADAIA